MPPDMTDLQAQLLGRPQVHGGQCRYRVRSDMRYLALARLAVEGSWLPRERLAFLFWPDVPPATARHRLRQLLKRVRRLDWLDGLETDARAVQWPVDCDVLAFRVAVDERRWDRAVRLYRGPLLDGITVDWPEYGRWLDEERERLHRLWRDAALNMADGAGDADELVGAVAALERVLSEDGLDEEALGALMRGCRRLERAEPARRAYRRFATRLRGELGMEPHPDTRALFASVRGPSGAAASAEGLPSPHNLPADATPFLGRERELEKLRALFADPTVRLVTLTGPGGVGKTRLALRAARGLLPANPDGVWLVPLVGLASARRMPTAVAEAMGIELARDAEAATSVLQRLRDAHTVLLLENYEHLLPGNEFVRAVLEQTTNVRLLVTSRQLLGLRGEHVYSLQGLELPAPGARTRLEDAAAVALFLAGARRRDHAFAPSRQDLERIARLCRAVDGMPLAVELAAGWTGRLSLEDAEHLALQGVGGEQPPFGDLPSRHRSMHAVAEASWRLLEERQRAVLARLSVFRGRFDAAAAGRVAGASRDDVAQLADRSLLARVHLGHYRMHGFLRRFAGRRLAADGAGRERVHRRHARYFVALARRRAEQLRGGREAVALRALERDLDDLRAALRWAEGRTASLTIAAGVEAVAAYYDVRGPFGEGTEVLEALVRALRRSEDPARGVVLGWALVHLANLRLSLEQLERGRAALDEGLPLLRRGGGRRPVAFGLRVSGDAAMLEGRPSAAAGGFRRSLALHRRQGDVWGIAWLQDRLGWAAIRRGRLPQAEACLRRSVATFRDLGNVRGLVWTQNDLGFLHRRRGLVEDAVGWHREALRLSRTIAFPDGAAWSLYELADALRDAGSFSEAEARLRESLDVYERLGSRSAVLPMYRLGHLLGVTGRASQAEAVLRGCLARCMAKGDAVSEAWTRHHLGVLAAERGEPARAERWLRGALAGFAGRAAEGGDRADPAEAGGMREPEPWGQTAALLALARVRCRLDRCEEAERLALDALRRAVALGSLPYQTAALCVWAGVAEATGRDEEAAEAAAITRAHPSAAYITREASRGRLEGLARRMPAERFDACVRRGRRAGLERWLARVASWG